MYEANNAMPLKADDYRFGDPIVRVPNKVLKKHFTRRQPVILANRVRPDTQPVLRFAMGIGGGTKGFTNTSVGIDYDAARELGVEYEADCDLTVTAASQQEIFLWYWHHDSPVVRMGIRMGALSVALGIVGAAGVAVSIAGLFM